jgi:phage tail sheath gpL-like
MTSTRSHQATEPAIVAAYFNRFAGTDRDHAVIDKVFIPGRGWLRYPIRKRISSSWARKHLSREGVTSVALSSGGHVADFTLAELTTRAGAR